MVGAAPLLRKEPSGYSTSNASCLLFQMQLVVIGAWDSEGEFVCCATAMGTKRSPVVQKHSQKVRKDSRIGIPMCGSASDQTQEKLGALFLCGRRRN
jgi:hypothetical protein